MTGPKISSLPMLHVQGHILKNRGLPESRCQDTLRNIFGFLPSRISLGAFFDANFDVS